MKEVKRNERSILCSLSFGLCVVSKLSNDCIIMVTVCLFFDAGEGGWFVIVVALFFLNPVFITL